MVSVTPMETRVWAIAAMLLHKNNAAAINRTIDRLKRWAAIFSSENDTFDATMVKSFAVPPKVVKVKLLVAATRSVRTF
jgi:hypothetical protein